MDYVGIWLDWEVHRIYWMGIGSRMNKVTGLQQEWDDSTWDRISMGFGHQTFNGMVLLHVKTHL